MRAIVAGVGVVLFALGSAPAADPVVAVLDPGKSDRVAVLEAKLLAEPGLTVVDRAAVEQVLKEQQVQALFGPQGVGQRVKLGAVLKADLLVLARPVAGAKEPALEVVVSETAGGLRLVAAGVPVTKDSAADVAALLDAVRAALKKHRETVREVVAVPSFVSRDLTYEFAHLSAGYAKLAEQAAVARPGVVAVELAEAEAIAAELRLAAPGAKLIRPLPLYLLGEFRHDGRGADRTVALTLRAERGGKPVGDSVTETVKVADVPGAVLKWASGRVAGAGAAPAAAVPKAEAKAMDALARGRLRLADWADAVALIEASLLLDPDQPEWLYLAVVEDLFSRRIVGWSMDGTMTSRLVVDALEMAIRQRLPGDVLVAHSDRGSQYASDHYRRLLDRHGIGCSMSRVAQCWDNAPVESFFASLKRELVHDERYATRDEARASIFEYVEGFYNRAAGIPRWGTCPRPSSSGPTTRNARNSGSTFRGEDHTSRITACRVAPHGRSAHSPHRPKSRRPYRVRRV